MVNATIAKLIYKEWQKTCDGSSGLSARAIFLQWWIANSPQEDDGFFVSKGFPTDCGGWDPLTISDYAIVELVNNGHVSIVDKGQGAQFLRITSEGQIWMSKHAALIDQLTDLAKRIFAKHSS